MKKLIIAAVVLLITSAQTFAGTIVISLSIELGHKNADKICIPKGVCNIGVSVGAKLATGSINDNTGDLELIFKKNSAQNADFQENFVNGVFQVPVAYNLSQEVCTKLGISKFTIKAGSYKVVESNTQYSIIFKK